MDRYEKARDYHKRGFNCCQSVLASFTDLTGMSEQECFDIAGGLCGAITGAAMTLGRLTPVDPADPVGSKKRTVALSKELQAKFSEKFGALRCQDLLGGGKFVPDERTPAAARMGLTGHCDIMIVTAVEIVEEILNQRG